MVTGRTLVIGLSVPMTPRQAAEAKQVALAQLPEGTKVLIVANCAALQLVEDQR